MTGELRMRVDAQSAGLSLERREGSDQYEQWLRAGFSQAAYLARDIASHGYALRETWTRVANEHKGMAVEKLGRPFILSFNYERVGSSLVAEDGELFLPMFSRAYEQALEDTRSNPRLSFLVRRCEADLANTTYLQELVSDDTAPEGTTVIISSPCPDPEDVGLSREQLEQYNYRPDEEMSVTWCAVKTSRGLKLQTVNLFHASPEQLAEATSMVAQKPVALADRENMPWQHTTFLPDSELDAAELFRAVVDEIIERDSGKQTYHGLEQHEQAGEDVAGLVETHEFARALEASHYIIEQVANSLVSGTFEVEPEYLTAVLGMKKVDGSFELSGNDRDAVMRVLNSRSPTQEDVYAALRVVQQTTNASLWATLRSLSDGDTLSIGDDPRTAAFDGIESVETHRQQGGVEYGCPGDSRSTSIYDMTPDQLASAFMRKTFITNCPMCDEEGVTATQENGAITCHSCKACVDVCTGEVLRKAQLRKRVKKAVGTMATKAVGIVDWLFDSFSSYKQKQKLKKQKSMR